HPAYLWGGGLTAAARAAERVGSLARLGGLPRALHRLDLPRAAFPVGGADLAALDLAGLGARQLGDEVEAARDLERRQAVAGERQDLLGQQVGGLVAGLQQDHRLDLLAPPVVRDTDGRAIGHGVVLDQL